MKRKNFLIISAVAVTAVAVSAIKLTHRRKTRDKPLEQPRILGNFCSDEDIRAIGSSYRNFAPAESKKEKLIELLLTDENGKQLNSKNNSSISDWLDARTDKEFKDDKTLVMAGWVITVTEARQCALYSLN